MFKLKNRFLQTGLAVSLLFLALAVPLSSAAAMKSPNRQVIIPGEDRFVPFVLVIRKGQTVEWINQDTDDHTVVSNDFFTTTDHKGVNTLVPGTDSNGGKFGTFELMFKKAGVFAYYCRFHATLDGQHQPIAPGPRGGIPGTPMNGIIVVLPGN